MVNSRGDSRLDGLEKATAELNAQFQRTDERVSALESKLDSLIVEMRAGFAALNYKSKATPEDGASSENWESNSPNSTTGLFPNDSSNGHDSNTKIPGGTPPITIPTFDGSNAIAQLARAEQYFLVSKIPLENRVSVAMEALAGPALPWIQLLMHGIPTLSWDRFTQEMMKRFGDSIAWKPKSVVVRQEIPTITTSAIHTDIKTKAINRVSLPLAVQQPIPPPVLVPLPSPPSPLTPATPPTLAPVTAPLLSTSGPYILQFQSLFSSLLRSLVSAAHQSTPMAVSFPRSLFSLTGTPFSYLVMLRFLHIVGNLLWFDALATTRKHEFEPPPDRVMYFEF